MFGMFRVYDLNQSFLKGPFQQLQQMAQLQNSLAQVRGLEKDMIIQYEQPDQLEKTHANWQAGLKQVRAVGEAFVAGAPEQRCPGLAKAVATFGAVRAVFSPSHANCWPMAMTVPRWRSV